MVAKLLCAALGCVLAAPAFAQGIPVQACSDVPCSIALVGTSGGVPDPAGTFQVHVVGGYEGPFCDGPLHNITVQIDFSECAPDIFICASQPAGHQVDCLSRTVSAVTDVHGVARFTIVGGAMNPSGRAPGYSGPTFCAHPGTVACAKVYAVSDYYPSGRVLLRTVGVTAYDQNLSGGVNPADFSAWLADAFSGTYYPRSDYDASASLAPPDLAKLLGVALGAGSTSSGAAYCQ